MDYTYLIRINILYDQNDKLNKILSDNSKDFFIYVPKLLQDVKCQIWKNSQNQDIKFDIAFQLFDKIDQIQQLDQIYVVYSKLKFILISQNKEFANLEEMTECNFETSIFQAIDQSIVQCIQQEHKTLIKGLLHQNIRNLYANQQLKERDCKLY
ncbi:unnamed protein product [Paramecium octaurelia]|uniref:Uncharacterized protein n=1 Tax=Paramecium octaurelia TaxID=43137 RepID=A0A8S1X1C5_PAROT|nr:unnamed protein product [Paramecium octaurelia]